MLVSGKTEASLRAQAARLRDHLAAHPDLDPTDVARSLATTRTQFEHRAVIVPPLSPNNDASDSGGDPTGDARTHIAGALDLLADGRLSDDMVVGKANVAGKVVFVFPGQGSQWAEMGRILLDTAPAFRDQIAACERALAPHVDWSLIAVLRGEYSGERPWLERIDVIQPVLFAMMVSLARLWRSLGVEPDAVVGHSQGEIAAAYVAGALSLDDAARIVALRSKELTRLAGQGAMASVEQSEEELTERLARWGDRLAVAVVNGSRSTVVSGDPDAIDELVAELQEAQIFARKVRVDIASHSAQMDTIHDELMQHFAGVTPQAAAIPMYSTVTTETIDGTALEPAYWYRNLRSPVRFGATTERLLGDGHRFFIECSPHPLLRLALQTALENADQIGAVVCTLQRERGDWQRVMLSVGELHTAGLEVDWDQLLPDGERVALPTYAFQRERLWLDIPAGSAQVDASPATAAESRFWDAVDRRDSAGLTALLGVDDSSLATVLPALASWRDQVRQQDVLDGLRYRVVWRPLARPEATRDVAGTWLLIKPAGADEATVNELAEPLARALGERGAELTTIVMPADDIAASEDASTHERSFLAEQLTSA
ncbi:MAG: acyltransferase domain-containing protein, partial [Myxococcota bacterium]